MVIAYPGSSPASGGMAVDECATFGRDVEVEVPRAVPVGLHKSSSEITNWNRGLPGDVASLLADLTSYSLFFDRALRRR